MRQSFYNSYSIFFFSRLDSDDNDDDNDDDDDDDDDDNDDESFIVAVC